MQVLCSSNFQGKKNLHEEAAVASFKFLSWNCLERLREISFRLRREDKPTRCHRMVYCTYNMLNMFRALLCPSSGARDYMCIITAYGVRCLGCWLLEVRCRTAGYEYIISAINHSVASSWFFFSTHRYE